MALNSPLRCNRIKRPLCDACWFLTLETSVVVANLLWEFHRGLSGGASSAHTRRDCQSATFCSAAHSLRFLEGVDAKYFARSSTGGIVAVGVAPGRVAASSLDTIPGEDRVSVILSLSATCSLHPHIRNHFRSGGESCSASISCDLAVS